MAHPAAARFWKKVYYGRKCWEWRGAKNKKTGYGTFWLVDRQVGAHCAAWILTHGPIPKHAVVMHTCDNPSCVRPEHLRLGSHAANMQDMVDKHRSRHAKFYEIEDPDSVADTWS